MATVEELVVKATPEGIQNVTSRMEGLKSSISESAEALKEQSIGLSDVAQTFKGSATAIVTGLAVTTGFLLSRIPVLGELTSGLVAIFDALAFQLDKRLRPVISPIVDGLFDLASAIYAGDWQEAKAIIGDFVGALRNFNWGSILTAAKSALNSVVQFVKDLGLVETVRSKLRNFFDVGEDQSIIGQAVNKLGTFIANVIRGLPGGEVAIEFAKFYLDALGSLVDFAGAATEKVADFLEALRYGNLIDTIVAGLKERSDKLTSGIKDLVDSVGWNKIGKAYAASFSRSFLEAIGFGSLVPDTPTGTTSSTGAQTINSSSATPLVTLDGEAVNDNQGRHRKDTLTLRGL